MSFCFNVIDQCVGVENDLKAGMYKGLNELAKQSPWGSYSVRALGLPVGIASAVLTITTKICQVAEVLIKGIANIVCCPFVDEAKLSTGCKYLFMGVPSYIGMYLPCSILSAITGLFYKTVSFVLSPEPYSEKLWADHDPKKGNELLLRHTKNAALKSMRDVAVLERKNGNIDEWKNWQIKASEAGNVESAYDLGLYYFATEAFLDAEKYFILSVNQDHQMAANCLYFLYQSNVGAVQFKEKEKYQDLLNKRDSCLYQIHAAEHALKEEKKALK